MKYNIAPLLFFVYILSTIAAVMFRATTWSTTRTTPASTNSLAFTLIYPALSTTGGYILGQSRRALFSSTTVVAASPLTTFASSLLLGNGQHKYKQSSGRYNKNTRRRSDILIHASVLFPLAAALSWQPLTTLAEAPALSSNSGERPKVGDSNESCPFYGCPLLPTDVHYSSDEDKQALEHLRTLKRVQICSNDSAETNTSKAVQKLSSSGRHDAATFTLIGYKGGQLTEQINQDRAIVVNPYYTQRVDKDVENASTNGTILLGVFDGHAPLGELVSEYTSQNLPVVFAEKLQAALKASEAEGDAVSEAKRVERVTTSVLNDTFVYLDQNAPADPSGGCTASVIYYHNGRAYVANAGDSRSMICVYNKSTNTTKIVYISREDKPHLQDERERVEQMGGQVYIPIRGTSRVVYHDPNTGAPTGLAMSRSIGDWAAGKLGVVPNPIVDVINIDNLVAKDLRDQLNDQEQYSVDDEGEVRKVVDSSHPVQDDVYVFAVSATDGMMDFLPEDDLAKILANSLFDPNGPHLISACERLIFAAANAWQKAKQGRYRDDIAIAVSVLRTPPEDSLPLPVSSKL